MARAGACASQEIGFSNLMRERFEQIYSRNEWGNGSGEGSHPLHTRKYARILQRLLRQQKVRSVVDLGCGDWQFSRHLDWQGAAYQGFDLVESVIEQNKQQFARPNVSFHVFSGNFDDLPDADLLIVKDVLQHWSNANVLDFLSTLARYPISLITNCINPRGATTNADIRDGDFRYLDIRQPPFKVPATALTTFTERRTWWNACTKWPRWRKLVLQISGPRYINSRSTMMNVRAPDRCVT
jgi:SAM-dependent methyltransferase